MLSDYPIKFNTTEIPWPHTWNEKYDVVEDVNESEAGTDIVNVRRIGKLEVHAEHGCMSDVVAVLMAFSKLPMFTLSIYDMIEEAYVEHTVRMRDFNAQLAAKSEGLSATSGVWKVSYTLYEV